MRPENQILFRTHPAVSWEELAGIGTWMMDLSLFQVSFSDNVYRLLGLTDTVLPDPGYLLLLVHPDDRELVQAAQEQMIHTGEAPELVFRIIRADNGCTRYLQQKGKRISDDGEAVLSGIIQDITTAREALLAAAHRADAAPKADLAELMINASPDRVLALDTSLRIRAWNDAYEDTLGISREEVLGKPFFGVFPELEESPPIREALHHALSGRKYFLPSTGQAYKDGYYESSFIPLKDGAGLITGVLNIVHDVSHRVKAEDQLSSLNRSLLQKNKELRQKHEELRTFSHITSHDLKEPLRKVHMFIDMLRHDTESRLSEAGQKYFGRVVASVERMEQLTDDILAFSHISIAGAEQSEVDLNHVLLFVRNSLRDQIAEKEAVLEAGQLPVITCSRLLITQLFEHIISNALRFQAPGNIPHITVQAAFVPSGGMQHRNAAGDDVTYVRIDFIDNGIGFEQKYSEQIFHIFQRLHSTGAYNGSGMGLSLCKKIVEIHEGFISVESAPGRGSTFSCFLPA